MGQANPESLGGSSMDVDEIKYLYKEFQAILSQTPPAGAKEFYMNPQPVENYNATVDLLSRATGESWSRFAARPHEIGRYDFNLMGFRQLVGQLINRMHSKYFSEEPEPFSGGPGTVITQTTSVAQSQQIEVQIEMILQLDRFIGDKINDYDVGTKERTFLDRLRACVKSAKGYLDFVRLVVQTAKDCGIELSEIAAIFS